MKIKFYSEICCEECNSIIHNHFDCPACKEEYAGTSMYIEPYDETEFYCENCRTEFFRENRDTDEWQLKKPTEQDGEK